jgi:hypothetical protein
MDPTHQRDHEEVMAKLNSIEAKMDAFVKAFWEASQTRRRKPSKDV